MTIRTIGPVYAWPRSNALSRSLLDMHALEAREARRLQISPAAVRRSLFIDFVALLHFGTRPMVHFVRRLHAA